MFTSASCLLPCISHVFPCILELSFVGGTDAKGKLCRRLEAIHDRLHGIIIRTCSFPVGTMDASAASSLPEIISTIQRVVDCAPNEGSALVRGGTSARAASSTTTSTVSTSAVLVPPAVLDLQRLVSRSRVSRAKWTALSSQFAQAAFIPNLR
jgi:hypothetical protein